MWESVGPTGLGSQDPHPRPVTKELGDPLLFHLAELLNSLQARSLQNVEQARQYQAGKDTGETLPLLPWPCLPETEFLLPRQLQGKETMEALLIGP